MSETETFRGWAILELMGHRVIGGLVQTPGGPGALAELVRIDIHDGEAITTQFYGAKSIYCMTPTTEELARAKASGFHAPISRYELPAAPEEPEDRYPDGDFEGDSEGEDSF